MARRQAHRADGISMKVFASEEDYSVYFKRDDGSEFEARHIATFTTEHPKFERNYYCALYSQEFNPGRDEPIVLFRVELGQTNEHRFYQVTDREEAQAMFEAWDALIRQVQNNQIQGVDIYAEDSSGPNQ